MSAEAENLFQEVISLTDQALGNMKFNDMPKTEKAEFLGRAITVHLLTAAYLKKLLADLSQGTPSSN